MARILVVDDNGLARFALRAMVEADGHEVREAGDGNSAITMLQDFKADLVITDMIMPGRHGLDAAAELLSAHPDVKVIAVSGGGRKELRDDINRAREMGIHATLIKPFEQTELQSAVDHLLAGDSLSP